MRSPYDKNGKLRPLPLGEQVFEKIITGEVAYVDKTDFVYRMTRPGNTFVFLNRPRRFGKTLLCSTLKAYFQGKRELFEGLAIDELEEEWTEYPVLSLSMNSCKQSTPEEVERSIKALMRRVERSLGMDTNNDQPLGDRLMEAIEYAYTRTGKRVVIIIDEYDAPLLEVMHDEEKLTRTRDIMKSFYEALKPSDEMLRFVFLTGITKFAQLSLFSSFNNINNISMDAEYASACGITPSEIEMHLKPYVERLALAMGTEYPTALDALKQMYDGYRFSSTSPDIYNPFSLVMALSKQTVKSYWFESGTPTFLIEMMRRFGTDPTKIATIQATESQFDQSTDSLKSIVPLMYQSGYLTIKGYDASSEIYTLGMPNKEVRQGIFESLAEAYAGAAATPMRDCMTEMRKAIFDDDIDGALRIVRDFLKSIPYANVRNMEGHYQQMLYIIFSIAGAYTDTEVRTSKGRIDMVMGTAKRLYLIEIKLDKSATDALDQINLKDYPSRFASYGKPICKVGVNFSSEERTIENWTIE